MTDARPADLLALGDATYVALTTFRKSGVPVSTPVWIVRDGDSLLVTTTEGTGKVKRLRNNGRVEVRPCNFRGRVRDGEPARVGDGKIDPAAGERATELFRRKYGLQYRIFSWIERTVERRTGRGGVILRIAPTGSSATA